MDRQLQSYLDDEQRRRERTPKAADLQARCFQLEPLIEDETRRGEIRGLRIALAYIVSSGRDIDAVSIWGPFEAEAEEMLGRAEAAIR